MDQKGKSCKIVLLGNSGVGKTSLVMRWTTGNYQSSVKSTIGANHQRKSLKIGSEELDLYLWDTAGQEQFQALTPLYAKSSASAVVVAAIDDLESFNALDHWLNLLNVSCEKVPPAILAVNKVDRTENIAMSNDDIEVKFGSSFAGIFYVSAQTGEGVNEMFVQSARCGYEFLQQFDSSNNTVQLNQTAEKSKCSC